MAVEECLRSSEEKRENDSFEEIEKEKTAGLERAMGKEARVAKVRLSF